MHTRLFAQPSMILATNGTTYNISWNRIQKTTKLRSEIHSSRSTSQLPSNLLPFEVRFDNKGFYIKILKLINAYIINNDA